MKDIFSERERLIVNCLGRKKMTLEQISNGIFKKGDKPFDDTITVANSVRRINRKCELYKLKNRENNKLIIKREKI